MAVVNSIFSGLQGSTQVPLQSFVPSTGFKSDVEGNRGPINVPNYSVAPFLFNESIDYSSRRANMPCKVINETVLRRPPLPSAGGMIAPSGIGRHQSKGLAYDPSKPINGPIMPQSDPYASGMNNKLGQP